MDLAELVRRHRPCLVLTGAGISTESGIPDFRSPSGIWAQYDPMEYATISAFHRDPAKVWEFYALRLGVLARAEPNAGHRVLARLEQRGLVDGVVTQNIDGLHQRAGSHHVIEVHGSIRTASCLACCTRVPLAEVVAALATAPAPACPRCGEIVKPDVVMFGELLPADAIDQAFALAGAAGLLLVVVVARGPSRGGPAGRDAEPRRCGRDRQPRADAVRPAGDGPNRGWGRRDPRGAREVPGRAYAAARLTDFSPRSCRQSAQTRRSTSYGIPFRCRIARLVTAVCLWSRLSVISLPL